MGFQSEMTKEKMQGIAKHLKKLFFPLVNLIAAWKALLLNTWNTFIFFPVTWDEISESLPIKWRTLYDHQHFKCTLDKFSLSSSLFVCVMLPVRLLDCFRFPMPPHSCFDSALGADGSMQTEPCARGQRPGALFQGPGPARGGCGWSPSEWWLIILCFL